MTRKIRTSFFSNTRIFCPGNNRTIRTRRIVGSIDKAGSGAPSPGIEDAIMAEDGVLPILSEDGSTYIQHE